MLENFLLFRNSIKQHICSWRLFKIVQISLRQLTLYSKKYRVNDFLMLTYLFQEPKNCWLLNSKERKFVGIPLKCHLYRLFWQKNIFQPSLRQVKKPTIETTFWSRRCEQAKYFGPSYSKKRLNISLEKFFDSFQNFFWSKHPYLFTTIIEFKRVTYIYKHTEIDTPKIYIWAQWLLIKRAWHP